MPYANITFQVQPGLRFVANDFVNLYGSDAPVTTTTTTTTTPTTTTTTTAAVYYYDVDKINCPGCTTFSTGLLAVSPTLKTNGFYYNIGDGFVYKVNFGTGAGTPVVDLTGAASAGTDCSATCAI
jgi:hypothetical protein